MIIKKKESLINKLEKVQYQGYPAITGAIEGTSIGTLYKELGLLSHLQASKWYRKRIFFVKY